jgi:MYXO-CTERM domain-containing protein
VFAEGVGVMGDAADAAKLRVTAALGSTDVLDTWVLLGDPATVLAQEERTFPKPNAFPADQQTSASSNSGGCGLGPAPQRHPPGAFLLLALLGVLLSFRPQAELL